MRIKPFVAAVSAVGALVIASSAWAAEDVSSTRTNKIDKIPVDPIEVEYTYKLDVTIHKQSRQLLPADWNKIVKNICVEAAKDFTTKADKQAQVQQ